MSHKTATVDDTVYFWFAANDTSGSGGDGSTPLYDVREAGAAAGAIPLLSGTPTLLSHANYPAGCHEIAVAATTGNGFAADDTFAVFCTLAIDSQNPSGFVGSCTLTPLAKAAALATVDTNVDSVLTDTGTTIPATLTTVEGKIDTVDTNVDSVLTDTGTTIPATIATAQIDLDSLTDVLSVGVAAETRNDTLIEQLKLIVAMVEHQRGSHTHQPIGNILFVDPVNGDTHISGNTGGITDPYSLVQDCHDNAVTDSNHDLIILLSGASGGATTLTEDVTLTKRYLFIRGPGRDFIWTRTGDGDTISITADGIEISGCQINTASGAASGNGISIASADFCKIEKCWFPDVVDTAIDVSVGSNYVITGNHISGCDKGVHINSGGGSAQSGVIEENSIHTTVSHGIHLAGADASFGEIHHNRIWDIGNDGITINASCTDTHVSHNEIGNCTNELIDDNGTDTVSFNNTDITSTLTAMQTDVTSILADTDELQT
ncbi:MAG: right-handed parallel beta-helix repeat-containing protein, partial [Colwellia sp.]|nr:right-handed parallel beta-helix repeat-containing protein [Colwellia sp.]